MYFFHAMRCRTIMTTFRAPDKDAPFQGLVLACGSGQDPYWIKGGNRTCDSKVWSLTTTLHRCISKAHVNHEP